MSSSATNNPALIKPPSEMERSLDRGFILLTKIFAFGVAGILILITAIVALQAAPAIARFGPGFITDSNWDPVHDSYGALPQIYGTFISSLIALTIALPISLGVSLFLSEEYLPPRLGMVVVFLVELLAAIPSVVYGLWGIFVLVPLLKGFAEWLHTNLGWVPLFSTEFEGRGMLPAAIVLAIMILPTISAISRDALISLPRELRQGALALGATRWEAIFKVLLPAAFSGIVGAVMLALGRALGETMAVTMLIGNSNAVSFSILAPANTIASLLANQFGEASGLQVAALMYAALVLFFLTFVINILAELLVRKFQQI